MEDAWQPEALRNRRLEQLRATMDDYIVKNTGQVEGNLPVFFGHVAATLDKTFPELDDRTYDDFIDATVFALLNVTSEAPTPEFLDKVLRHAMGNKRRRKGRATLDVIVALKLIDSGNYYQAFECLTPHRGYDGRINAAIAYCYYALSLAKTQKSRLRPDDLELHAREEMLNLSRVRAPLNRLGLFNRKDSRLNSIFWFMLDLAFAWFPSEPEFYRMGVTWTKHEGDVERRNHLLAHATERFSDDRFFLTEAFNTRVELRNGSGAAAIVKQMMQQYPDDLEPLYYGMKLAILGAQPRSYASFRKLAILKEFPRHLLLMLDAVFEVMCNHKMESYVCFGEAKKASPGRDYYTTALDYILRDFIEGDEERAKRARSTFFTAMDQYCMQVLKIRE
ncbi:MULTISPECIES: hypothetical protein [Methanoculleus]|uniref:Uncharacterized protein n=2 Tax=Methanoculleus TaxID=45989 RepID=A3CWS3_METMJ|nr:MULTISPECIES: hypothetical protein [Methanoculleus]ABN57823.1 hypothetical protein Memar_1897 [Methanoculleus marisnigri JR1]MCC7554512.1 hypothetical protein [Methanoculleus marisnigri]UYU19212.1 hypothetical protein OH143_03740 [Methanoculleus submarinus]